MTKYIVETYTLCEGWVNCWTVWKESEGADPIPMEFEMAEDAQEEISAHIADCLEAVESDDMQDAPKREEFRIRQI